MTQYLTKIKLILAITFLLFSWTVAYGENNGVRNLEWNNKIIKMKGKINSEIHLRVVSPESERLIFQKISTLDGGAKRIEFMETVQYYKIFCNGSPAFVGKAKLMDKVSISQIGKGTYAIDIKISKIGNYREQNESVTSPGNYFLKMCQVYEPQIETKRRIWTVREQNGIILFSKRLNGRIVKVFFDTP